MTLLLLAAAAAAAAAVPRADVDAAAAAAAAMPSLGEWAADADTVAAAADALRQGRPVVVRNALSESVAAGLVDELRRCVSSNPSAFSEQVRSGGHAERAFRRKGMPPALAARAGAPAARLFEAPMNRTVCSQLSRWAGGVFAHRMHQVAVVLPDGELHPEAEEAEKGGCSLSRTVDVFREMMSEAATKWVDALFGREVGFLGDTSATVYHPLDYNTPHTDSGPSHRTVAMTVHLAEGPDGGQWQADWGGDFVWCGPSWTPIGAQYGEGGVRGFWKSEPKTVSATRNQLVLFAVTSDSWHFVSPVRNPPPGAYRLSLQAWWRPHEGRTHPEEDAGECLTGSGTGYEEPFVVDFGG